MGLKYIDRDGSEKVPLCIHRAPLSTHERLVGFLIEHFAGHFPLWLAPVQVNVLPVAAPHEDPAAKLAAELKGRGVRVAVLPSVDSLGKRIRDGEMMKVPYLLVLGDREIAEKTVTVRNTKTKKQVGVGVGEFATSIEKDIESRALEAGIGSD
jgi:threonyl-tRNA synthetase